MRQLASFGCKLEFQLILMAEITVLLHADGSETHFTFLRLMAVGALQVFDDRPVPRHLHQSDMLYMGEAQARVFHHFADVGLYHSADIRGRDAGLERQPESGVIRAEIMNIGKVGFREVFFNICVAQNACSIPLHGYWFGVLVLAMAFRAAHFPEYVLVQLRLLEVSSGLCMATQACLIAYRAERGFMTFGALGAEGNVSRGNRAGIPQLGGGESGVSDG